MNPEYRKYKIWKLYDGDINISSDDLNKCLVLNDFINNLKNLNIKVSSSYPDTNFYLNVDTVWIEHILNENQIIVSHDSIYQFALDNFTLSESANWIDEIENDISLIIKDYVHIESTKKISSITPKRTIDISEHLKIHGHSPINLCND